MFVRKLVCSQGRRLSPPRAIYRKFVKSGDAWSKRRQRRHETDALAATRVNAIPVGSQYRQRRLSETAPRPDKMQGAGVRVIGAMLFSPRQRHSQQSTAGSQIRDIPFAVRPVQRVAVSEARARPHRAKLCVLPLGTLDTGRAGHVSIRSRDWKQPSKVPGIIGRDVGAKLHVVSATTLPAPARVTAVSSRTCSALCSACTWISEKRDPPDNPLNDSNSATETFPPLFPAPKE
ncbi:hypothetical protein ACLKA6_012879 [Drosophila palustris]